MENFDSRGAENLETEGGYAKASDDFKKRKRNCFMKLKKNRYRCMYCIDTWKKSTCDYKRRYD